MFTGSAVEALTDKALVAAIRARDAMAARVSEQDAVAALRDAAVPLEGVDDAEVVAAQIPESADWVSNCMAEDDVALLCVKASQLCSDARHDPHAWNITCMGMASAGAVRRSVARHPRVLPATQRRDEAAHRAARLQRRRHRSRCAATLSRFSNAHAC